VAGHQQLGPDTLCAQSTKPATHRCKLSEALHPRTRATTSILHARWVRNLESNPGPSRTSPYDVTIPFILDSHPEPLYFPNLRFTHQLAAHGIIVSSPVCFHPFSETRIPTYCMLTSQHFDRSTPPLGGQDSELVTGVHRKSRHSGQE